MRRFWFASVVLGLAAAAGAEIVPVSKDECAAWCDHLMPLPHEIAIPRKALVRPQEIALRLRPNAGEVEAQALSELTELFKNRAGLVPGGSDFEVLMGVLDKRGQIAGVVVTGADRLRTLPHSDQAYLIQPSGDSRLIIASLNERGVYHGAQTLIQLLEAKITKEQVAVPLATVVDWPDMDERGLWNFDLDLIPWLVSLKLNFAKVPSPPERIQRDRPVKAKPRSTKRFPNVLQAGRRRALKAVPNVAHLNYIGAKHGGYDTYPELAGKGAAAVPNIWYKPRRIRVPCAACPVWTKIIGEYMADLASKGAQEISVWLSEHRGQCQCEECLKAGQLRMETRAACKGWLEARKQYPDLVLRIFYCMGGESLDDTYQCLMELPSEVKIERCYGLYGKAFDRAAAEGRWLASYSGPPLARGEFSGLRFYGAQRTRDYARQLLDRKWDAVYSINYVYSNGTYQRGLYDFHVSALAEWTWNLDGRSVQDFAKAWATRAGHDRPEAAAEWVVLMDPIERALNYVLTTRTWSKLPDALKSREPLQLGRGILAGFPNAKSLSEQMAECERARQLAETVGAHDIVLETQYVAAFLRSLTGLNGLLAQGGKPQASDAALADFHRATQDMIDAMNRKTDLLTAEPKSFAESMKKKHEQLWQDRVTRIARALAE